MRICGGSGGGVGRVSLTAVFSSELSTPGPSGKSSCMLSLTFQVGFWTRFSGTELGSEWSGGELGSGSGCSGSVVSIALTSSDTIS